MKFFAYLLAGVCALTLTGCASDAPTQAIAYRPVQEPSLAEQQAQVERDAQAVIFTLTELAATGQLPADGVILLRGDTLRIASAGQTVTRPGLRVDPESVLKAGYTGADGAWCIAMTRGEATTVQAFPAMVIEASSCMEGGVPLP